MNLPPFRNFRSAETLPQEPSLDVARFVARSAKLRRGERLTEKEEEQRLVDNAIIAGDKQRKGG
jgi:hypothetical protein